MSNPPSMSPNEQAVQLDRDGASLLLMGGFFAVLAVLVLVGTFWALERPHAAIVNFGAGAALLSIGGAVAAVGVRLRRKAAQLDGSVRP